MKGYHLRNNVEHAEQQKRKKEEGREAVDMRENGRVKEERSNC